MDGNDLNIALKAIKVQTKRKLYYYYLNHYSLFNKEQLDVYHNRNQDTLNCEVLIKTLIEIENKYREKINSIGISIN